MASASIAQSCTTATTTTQAQEKIQNVGECGWREILERDVKGAYNTLMTFTTLTCLASRTTSGWLLSFFKCSRKGSPREGPTGGNHRVWVSRFPPPWNTWPLGRPTRHCTSSVQSWEGHHVQVCHPSLQSHYCWVHGRAPDLSHRPRGLEGDRDWV